MSIRNVALPSLVLSVAHMETALKERPVGGGYRRRGFMGFSPFKLHPKLEQTKHGRLDPPMYLY